VRQGMGCGADKPLQIEKVRSWLSGEHRQCAVWLVSDYYARFRGARFDALAGGGPVDTITRGDLDAARALSIGFPQAFVHDVLHGDAGERIKGMLSHIPSDIALEDLSYPQFEELLGPESFAWKVWDDLAATLGEAGARAPLVGASKLLAAKRPLLVPLEDSYVRRALGSRRRDIWETIFRTVKDAQVRDDLMWVRRELHVSENNIITVHRLLDVIAWRKQQGHCWYALGTS
jgi:hypothetical protein